MQLELLLDEPLFCCAYAIVEAINSVIYACTVMREILAGCNRKITSIR